MKAIKISYQPVEWLGDKVRILDQTQLPTKEIYIELTTTWKSPLPLKR